MSESVLKAAVLLVVGLGSCFGVPPSAVAKTTELVSVVPDGSQLEGVFPNFASLSADGRFVAFARRPRDITEVLVRDRLTRTTVTIHEDNGPIRGVEGGPVISADGRSIAFVTGVPDPDRICPSDQASHSLPNLLRSVFVHDRVPGLTTRLAAFCSIATGFPLAMSADGRFVVSRDNHGPVVFDRQLGRTMRAVVAEAISADGRFVAGLVSTLVSGGRESSAVIVQDLVTGVVERADVAISGNAPNVDPDAGVAISGDGRFVAFTSPATDLVPGDTNRAPDVFVRDRLTGTTERVSVASDGAQANGGSGRPAISPDGRFVAFVSVATNLVVGDGNALEDVFVHDRRSGLTERVSVTSDGTEQSGGRFSCVGRPAISVDGRFVGFGSCAPNLVGHDFDGLGVVVFVRDRGETVTSFVAGLYEYVLGRAPDPGGLSGWIGFLDADCHPSGFDALVRAFFESAEFRGRPSTLDGLVTTLYRAVLGRAPDPGGLVAWTAAFRRERLDLASDVMASQEFRTVLPDLHNPAAVITLVTRFYVEILGRAPDPGGLQAWVDFILSTGHVDAVALDFLASAEFEARPLTFRGYVAIFYRALLGREPDPDGLDARDDVLSAHLERVITEGFVSSEELQVRRHEICGN